MVKTWFKNGNRIYVNIYIDKKIFREFSLLIWTLFIDQFVYPLGGEGCNTED